MEVNVIYIIYYGISMIGLSWYMLKRIEDGICEEDVSWFLYVSILVIYLIPVVLEVIWKII